MAWDAAAIRSQFAILQNEMTLLDGSRRRVVYLDHGASTHAPAPVLAAYIRFLERYYANIHRGHHTLSLQSSELFDEVHTEMAAFVGAKLEHQNVLLTGNTTQALDLAAWLMKDVPAPGGPRNKPGTTAVSLLEHHSNDLPHRRAGPVVHFGLDGQGRIDLDDLQRVLDQGTVKLVAVSGASNVTGWMPPIHKVARMAHGAGARILVDAAQLLAHAPIDVKAPSSPEHIDFLAVGSHKAYAPFGSGFLLAPRDVCDDAPPHLPGGGTVTWVTEDNVLFTDGPDRHQGGTPNIAGAIGFAAALRWLKQIGMDRIRDHERDLCRHGLKRFAELEAGGVVLYGPRDEREKLAVFPFNVQAPHGTPAPGGGHASSGANGARPTAGSGREAATRDGMRPHALVSAILNFEGGIATRNGCFCAHPYLHGLLGLGDASAYTEPLSRGETIDLPGAVRASCGIYNTTQELDALAMMLETIAAGKETGTYDLECETGCKPVNFEYPHAEFAMGREAGPIVLPAGVDRA